MQQFTQYLRDTVAEMKQVKWPTQNQALVYTALIILVCTVIAIFVSIFDFIFASGIDFIINRF
ncbi:MAG: preprotein translocase subunit SecE [Patescibacteria group bacterium]